MAKKVKRLPTSGDRLTDWHFRQIIFALEKGVKVIRKKKRLVDTGDKPPRKSVSGLYDPVLEMIFLNSAKSVHPTWRDYVGTLIHEAAHVIHPIIDHRSVEALETILMLKFTDEQKRYLKKFIPKKEVKKNPMPAKDIPETRENKKEQASTAPQSQLEPGKPSLETATPEQNNGTDNYNI